MGMFSSNPKEEPMHYGEVFGVWSALSVAKGQLAAYQVYYNHAGDEDLKKFIQDMVDNVIKPGIKENEDLLKRNSVGLPAAPPERSEANREDIPVGARVMDPEISATISKDISQGLVADSMLMGQCIREDIAMMYGEFHMKKAQMGAKLLKMNKEKGWLIPPPLHKQSKTNQYE
ncbi:uncharacterized protein JNUCC1_02059 [Lentibacillus sp. JNUCC-1]|uniref:DUF3231 family protein n=1 Tax=Lentibacillus sp. JNUCC-1 TaxID=2654513 RepID=UPI0012E7E7B5|nr:DUF3231 family protein [Lentibacillus sp. JNUCC-1]MUV38223.1 uncharacterized protein [Lentibacillus sp. JNUCC-1]